MIGPQHIKYNSDTCEIDMHSLINYTDFISLPSSIYSFEDGLFICIFCYEMSVQSLFRSSYISNKCKYCGEFEFTKVENILSEDPSNIPGQFEVDEQLTQIISDTIYVNYLKKEFKKKDLGTRLIDNYCNKFKIVID